jgi:hypothetical protein
VPESFDELLAECKQSAIKLEFRDLYMTSDPGYIAWRAGDLDRAVEEYADWTALARSAVARGVQMSRARVVSEPVSEYITFEHAVTPRVKYRSRRTYSVGSSAADIGSCVAWKRRMGV